MGRPNNFSISLSLRSDPPEATEILFDDDEFAAGLYSAGRERVQVLFVAAMAIACLASGAVMLFG